MKIINTIALGIAVITNFLLAFFVLFKNIKSIINRVFSLLIFGVVGWTLSLLILLYFPNVILGNLAFAFAAILPASFFHFSVIFPFKIFKKRKVVIIAYTFSVLFIILSFTPYLSENIDISKGYIIGSTGKAFPVFVIYLFIFIAWGLINFFKKFKTTHGIKRIQIIYLFLGILLVSIVGLTTNIILPIFKIFNLNFIGPSFSIILTGLVAYSIVKHRFLDIRFVLRKSFIYISLAIFIFFAYYFVLWLDNFFFKSPFTLGAYLSALIIVPLFLISFNYLSQFLKRFTNKYFFSGLYDYQKVLEKFAKNISQTINLDEVINVITKTIQNTMRLDNLAIALTDQNNNNLFILNKVIGFNKEEINNICNNHSFYDYLKEIKAPVVIDEMLSDHRKLNNKKLLSDIQALKKIGIAMVLPFIAKNQINSIIFLGEKISKDAYTKEDIELLSTLSNQAAVALENARLYQQVQDFTKTLQKKVDEQTRDIKKKNVHLQKLLKMRSEFLDITSHQLRTPTSVLIGILEMAVAGDLDKLPKKRKKEQLKGAYLKARKLEQIVSDLLRASELDSAPFQLADEDFEEINLKEFLEGIIASKKIEADKQDLKIELEKPLSVKKIYGEDKFLEEAIGNLLDNAIKYTPPKNEKTKEKGRVSISVKKDKKYAQIKIKDNGIGIPKKEVEKLFRKFSRASNAKEMYTDGTGLGLFIVKEIVKGHRGQVEVESKINQGTEFTVFIPLKKPA